MNVLSCLDHRKAMILVRGTRSRRNALLLNACESAIRRESEANGRVSPKQDFAGRNAPGFRKRRSASPKFPPAIHPREPPDPASLCSFGRALRTSHACTLSTLRHAPGLRNRELSALCAEAVEDGNCLWKALEKRDETARTARHRGLCVSPPNWRQASPAKIEELTPVSEEFAYGGKASYNHARNR